MTYRVAREGRNGWVVRKHQPPNYWKPVMYAASEELAREYVKRSNDGESNARKEV